jgi:hypothetical protein
MDDPVYSVAVYHLTLDKQSGDYLSRDQMGIIGGGVTREMHIDYTLPLFQIQLHA